MATIKEITTMCRNGNVVDAYNLAKADYDAAPQNVWAQREMGWALYYLLKEDLENQSIQEFFVHLEELLALDLLSMPEDSLIYDNVLWKLTEYIKTIPIDKNEEIEKVFHLINKIAFTPSKGYSYLLKLVMKFENWNGLIDFIEWWNLDNLMDEDYKPFQLENGRTIMSFAEQAYIAYSKVLLKLNDKEKIQAFLPKIEKLMDDYPEMLYPGYYCGKLMLALGAEREEALRIILPFVRKKKADFWVWQLLSELYTNDSDTQLACLLRAIHCRTQEAFLGKVRLKLVSIYVSRNDYPRAKYHLDQITRCYVKQGWHLPYEAQNWMRGAWIQNTQADSSDGIEYKRYTDAILSQGANESIAIVTYIDTAKKRVSVIFGKEMRKSIHLSEIQSKVKVGSILKLTWFPKNDKDITIIGANILNELTGSEQSYAKQLEGKVSKKENQPFAFVKKDSFNCFVKPDDVQNYNLKDKEQVSVLAVLDYNKKKEAWTWTCVSIKK